GATETSFHEVVKQKLTSCAMSAFAGLSDEIEAARRVGTTGCDFKVEPPVNLGHAGLEIASRIRPILCAVLTAMGIHVDNPNGETIQAMWGARVARSIDLDRIVLSSEIQKLGKPEDFFIVLQILASNRVSLRGVCDSDAKAIDIERLVSSLVAEEARRLG